MTGFSKKLSTGAVLAISAVLFVALTLIFNGLLRGWRIDLTSNQQYTLAEGTKQIIGEIDEPLNLYFFFSEKASESLPQLRAYAGTIREMLQEMAARSKGKINLNVIDPAPFSEDEDRATAFGLQSVPVGQSGEGLIFGLAGTNATNGQAVIPFFQPDKEAFLEYDLAKVIQSLNKPEKPVVGILSSIALTGGFDPATQQMTDPWVISQQLSELFTTRTLAIDAKSIEEDVKVLVLIHPKELSEDTLYAVDQFVLRGGRLMVFVDPQAVSDQSQADPNNPTADMFAAKSSNLEKLFGRWGVQYDPGKVVIDRKLGLTLQTGPGSAPEPDVTILGITKEVMNQKDVISTELESINMDKVGSFSLADDATGVTLEPLIQSSTDATLIDADRVRFIARPVELLDNFTPSGTQYTIAGRLSGKLSTAFPERTDSGHLTESSSDVDVVLVADVDVLSNRVWVQVQQFFGKQVANAFANNGDFIANAVDNLTGSSGLISIRARQGSARPFTVVADLRRKAEESYRSTEQKLQDELRQTEQRLTELQDQKQGAQSSVLTLSPEQQTEIQRFRDRKVEIRKKLRDVRFELDGDIRALGSRVKAINIALIPVVLIILGILYFRRRGARRRQAAAA